MNVGYVDTAAYLAETYGLMARAHTVLGRDREARDAWQSSLSFALAVVESATCATPEHLWPSDCVNAQAWSREAKRYLESSEDSPP